MISKTMYLKYLTILLALVSISCSSDDDTEYGNWVESSSFDGDPRGNSVSFVIGDKGYLVKGYDGDDYLSDLWEYNKNGDYWVKLADFPGVARSGAVGFELNGKGYIGTGYDGEDKLNDFWCYNPSTNTWEQKADFIGSARYGAVGFSIAGSGYIGTGYDGSNYLDDFWEYNRRLFIHFFTNCITKINFKPCNCAISLLKFERRIGSIDTEAYCIVRGKCRCLCRDTCQNKKRVSHFFHKTSSFK